MFEKYGKNYTYFKLIKCSIKLLKFFPIKFFKVNIV